MRKTFLSLRPLPLVLVATTTLTVLASASEFEKSHWIAPPADRATNAACPIFRKEFFLERKPRSATLRIIGLGDYDVRVNGRRLAATGINQAWSQYEKTLYYRDFDLSSQLVSGTNCVGVMLFNSFWHNPNAPAGRYNKGGPQRTVTEPYLLCAEITFTKADGSVSRIGADVSWRTTDGPITFSHIFAGEDFDARRQLPGWDRAGFDDRSWQASRETDAPTSKIERQSWPNISGFEHQTPVSVMGGEAHVGERQARTTHFLAWRADLGLALGDCLALLVHTAAIEDEDAALGFLFRHRDGCRDYVADVHRTGEAQRLPEIDRSRPRQFGPEYR